MKTMEVKIESVLRFLIIIFILSSVCVSAQAVNTGSLQVEVEDAGSEMMISLYRVAEQSGALTEDFHRSGVSAEELLTEYARPTASATLFQFAVAEGLEGTERQTSEDGIAYFSELSEGIYLIVGQGTECEFAPFLVSIPTVIEETVIYDVKARPKTELPDDPEETDPPVPGESDPPEEPTPTPSVPGIPQTGVNVWPVYLLAGAGGLTVLCGLFMILRRSDDDEKTN